MAALQLFLMVVERVWAALVILRSLLSFKQRPDDIYIATFPKSGTTWMQMILFQLKTGGQGEFDHILQVSPNLDELGARGRMAHLEQLPSPRLLKTHLPYDRLRPSREARCIYVTRDPVDTLISCYHHEQRLGKFTLDFDRFFEKFLRGRIFGVSWFEHTASWRPHCNDKNVLWVRYEDLVRDLEGQIRRVAAFCNFPIEEERMGEILRKCGFEYMRANDAKFDNRLGFYDKQHPKTGFIRKGLVGAERDRLKPEQATALNTKVSALWRRLNLPSSP